MSFLERINWHSDDGVFFPMLMDWARNQYYDKVIPSTVPGRECVEVGFGTGMLSLLALKHGATHVTAYESNADRYQLGQYIIDHLGLNNQIDLIQQEFSWRTPVNPASVIISETVGTQLWSEHLWFSMSRTQTQTWVPGQVFMQVIAEPVAQTFADDLFRPSEHFEFFNPAVDINPDWVTLINQLVQKTPPHRSVNYNTDNHQTTVWGGWTYANWVKINQQPRAEYRINLGNQTMSKSDTRGSVTGAIDFDRSHLELVVELDQTNNQPVLVVPRVGFCHHTDQGPISLYLDQATSWGGGCTPLLVTDQHRYVTIKHCVSSGIITYSLE